MVEFISLTLKILFFLLPIFPWIKEYYSSLGNIIELLLILNIYIGSLFIIVKHKNKLLFKQFILLNIAAIILFIYALMCNEGFSNGLGGLRIYIEFIMVIMGINIVYVYKGREKVLNVIKYLYYITIILSILGIIQIIIPDVILNMHSSDMYTNLRVKSDFKAFSKYNRVMSLMNDPNVYAIYLIVLYPILNILNLESIISKRIINISKLLIVVNIIMTNSRQGIILYIIYIILTLMLKIIESYNSRNINISINTFIKIGIFFILILFVIFNVEYILEDILRIDTLSNLNGRSNKNALVINMIFNSSIMKILIGNGISHGRNFIFENSYFLLIYQFGFIGIIIMMSIIMKMFLNVMNIAKERTNQYIIPLIIFFIAMYVGDWVVIPQVTVSLISTIFILI